MWGCDGPHEQGLGLRAAVGPAGGKVLGAAGLRGQQMGRSGATKPRGRALGARGSGCTKVQSGEAQGTLGPQPGAQKVFTLSTPQPPPH